MPPFYMEGETKILKIKTNKNKIVKENKANIFDKIGNTNTEGFLGRRDLI